MNAYSSIRDVSQYNLRSLMNSKNYSHRPETYLGVSDTKLFTDQFSESRRTTSYTKTK